MSKPKILLVEDEKSHQILVEKAFEGQFQLFIANNYQEGLQMLKNGKYDLFLLDIMLPDGDGYELCAQIKMQEGNFHSPVIFLTSKEAIKSKVLGFSLGADDYIVKPCDPLELKARVESKIRKMQALNKATQEFKEGHIVFELEKQRVFHNLESGSKEYLDLTPLEFKLLLYLARHKDHVLSRSQILDGVWGQTTNVLDRSVDTYIAALRKKLGNHSKLIRSVHGVGYRFSHIQENKKAI